MSEPKLIALTCQDRTKESGPYGGYTTWELFMEAMARQRKKPLEDRIRPCLKCPRPDWWIPQVPWCQKCEDSTWHIIMDGKIQKAKARKIENKTVELCVSDTGQLLTFIIGKGFV